MSFFLPNPRTKAWVKTLLDHKAPLKRAAGGELGPVLGCGHWGCVVDLLDTPYVLKLTVDPTEAHVWAKIQSLVDEEHYGGDGFPRLKKIFELRPGISYGNQGRTRKAYGIVREKIAVVWGKNIHELSPFTAEYLGNSQYKHEEFDETIEALQRYRMLAMEYHLAAKTRRSYPDDYRQGLQIKVRAERLQKLEATTHRMNGAIGGPLGESLGMLLSNEIVLNDVHLNNIGWRYLEEVDGEEGYTTLVIFDPGHTPTAKRDLPREQWRQFAMLG